MIRSLRMTLIYWYLGILTFILCTFGGLLYTNVKTSLERDIKELVLLRAQGVSDTITAFLEAERLKQSFHILKEVIDKGLLNQLIDEWSQEPDNLEIVNPIRVTDTKGEAIYASKSFRRLPEFVPPVDMRKLKNDKPVYATLTAPGHRIQLITLPVLERGEMLYIVQVAAPLEQADASLRRLRTWLFGLIPTMLILASVGGWFLATRALSPIGKMVKKAQLISVEQLHERLDVPDIKDELQELAKTFNEMLARLERAFKRLRQFSAAASHELRTPLTIIKGELELALRKPRDTNEYQNVLKSQLETVDEMARTVEQLLTLARSETGKEAVAWQPVELGDLAKEAKAKFQKLAEAKNIAVQVEAKNPAWIHGERILVKQLISNLLDNAIKHSSANGAISIEVRADDHEATVKVSDRGEGILPEELPHIFDRFFSATYSGKTSPTGGLGLGLCRWIAEAHEGKIQVASIPQHGSDFIVSFPLAK